MSLPAALNLYSNVVSDLTNPYPSKLNKQSDKDGGLEDGCFLFIPDEHFGIPSVLFFSFFSSKYTRIDKNPL